MEEAEVKIENRVLKPEDIYSPVTFVPGHVNGNAGHIDCEQGVLISWDINGVRVLYCKGRKIQRSDPKQLVWG